MMLVFGSRRSKILQHLVISLSEIEPVKRHNKLIHVGLFQSGPSMLYNFYNYYIAVIASAKKKGLALLFLCNLSQHEY
jgi:hypothetical protein